MSARGGRHHNRRMFQERRASAREPLSLPVQLADGSHARTRDISAEGLFLELPAGAQVPDWFSLQYEVPQTGLKFVAVGEVVRTEAGGVALRMHRPRLEPLPEAD